MSAGFAIDRREVLQALYGFLGIVDQEARLTVFDHLAAGAEVHGDHRNAGGIGFCQDQPESLGDSIQMQQS